MHVLLIATATEWITAIASALAALGTIGAVIVALWGDRWRARNRQPVIKVEPFYEEFDTPIDNEPRFASISISNEQGKEMANDVEAILSLSEVSDRHGPHIEFRPTKPL